MHLHGSWHLATGSILFHPSFIENKAWKREMISLKTPDRLYFRFHENSETLHESILHLSERFHLYLKLLYFKHIVSIF